MASKSADVRPKITMACVDCKERNYITKKNRRNDPDRMELKKPDSVGSTFAGTDSITVSQSEIDAFCAVIGETDTSIAPPTFTIRITLTQFEEILTRPEIGLDWSRLVHGDQKFEIFSPVKAGDQLTCAATIESYRVAAGNEIVTVRSDLKRDERLVISAWSTLVVRA
ncbi:MAG: hypothetical protein RL470_1005 [Actinomycetota bacterium]